MARRKLNDSKSTSAATSSSSSWQNLRMSQSARRQSSNQSSELIQQQEESIASVASNDPLYGDASAENLYTTGSTFTTSPSEQLSLTQPGASSRSSIASSTGGGGGESSRGQYDVSASSSSSSSASVTTQAKSSRARVSMACIHCRSRKIRCDGSQPTCSTCFRLGRICMYESISELENIMAREKKKRSREAKQARLSSLAGLGIPIPARSASTSSAGAQQSPTYTRSISSGSAGASSAPRLHGASTVGVIRDSRLARQGRTRPYSTQHQQPQQPNQYFSQQHINQASQYIPHQGLMPPQGREPNQRRRGVTLDSIPTKSPPLHQDEQGASIAGTSINVTSLSQPTTPEAAYSLHASMLSRELSSQQTHSPAEIVHERPFTASDTGRRDAHDYNLVISAPATTLPPDESGAYRPDQYASEVDYTLPSTAFTSAVPSATSRSSMADSTLANSFQSNVHPPGTSASPSMIHRSMGAHSDLEQQLALRRRSSFDVGDFWRRSSVADAAVVNFFDRVVHAKGPKRREDEVGATMGTSARSTHDYASAIPIEQQEQPGHYETREPYGTTLTSAPSMTSSGAEGEAFYPTYSTLQQVMMNTAPLDTPYTALTSSTAPLTFQHPFAVATGSGDQPEIQASNRMQDRDDSQTMEPYHHVPDTGQFPSQAFVPPTYHQSMVSSIPALPSPSSSSSSTSFSRLRSYGQGQQQLSPILDSMNAPSFSTASRIGQRAPPPQQLDLANLADFESHRQSHPMHTDGSSSTYATADSVISPYHHHRMMSAGTPGSATMHPSVNMSGSAGAYFGSASNVVSGGGGGFGQAPPLPTPMTELSSNMMAMAPPSTYMVSPSGLTRTQGDRGGNEGGDGSNDPYYPQQEDPYQHQQHQNWQ